MLTESLSVFYGVLSLPLVLKVSPSLLVVPVVGVILLLWGFRNFKKQITMKNKPVSKIRSMAIGPVKLKGKARPANKNQILKSPLSNEECVAYSYEVKEYRKNSSSSNNSSGWKTIRKENRALPFKVDDGTGSVMVEATKADYELEDDNVVKNDVTIGKSIGMRISNFFQKLIGLKDESVIEKEENHQDISQEKIDEIKSRDKPQIHYEAYIGVDEEVFVFGNAMRKGYQDQSLLGKIKGAILGIKRGGFTAATVGVDYGELVTKTDTEDSDSKDNEETSSGARNKEAKNQTGDEKDISIPSSRNVSSGDETAEEDTSESNTGGNPMADHPIASMFGSLEGMPQNEKEAEEMRRKVKKMQDMDEEDFRNMDPEEMPDFIQELMNSQNFGGGNKFSEGRSASSSQSKFSVFKKGIGSIADNIGADGFVDEEDMVVSTDKNTPAFVISNKLEGHLYRGKLWKSFVLVLGGCACLIGTAAVMIGVV